MRGLVVGLGSIGRRHLSNLASHEFEALAVVSSSATPNSLPAGVSLYRNLKVAIQEHRPTFAIIANASPAHMQTALRLAEADAHLFIEKPLASDLEGADLLKKTCQKRELITLVGYSLRFLPILQRVRALLEQRVIGKPIFLSADVGQYLPDWRPGQDYRQTVSARRDLGGGALLELSHEIDYVRWLLGYPLSIFAMTSQSGLIEVDVEDTADILLNYGTARARIHLDFLERGKSRNCRIVGSEGTLQIDLIAGTINLLQAGSSVSLIEKPAVVDPYKVSLAHFLECIASRQASQIPLSDGIATMELIEAARHSAKTGISIALGTEADAS